MISRNKDRTGKLAAYYAARAQEYERIYDKPERQDDLARLRRLIPAYFSDRKVLEIACGTGYWTQFIAPAARQVTATDVRPDLGEGGTAVEYTRLEYYWVFKYAVR